MSIIGRYRGILNTQRDGLWNPSELGAAMILWWDSGDDSSYTTSGIQLTQLNDKSLSNRVFIQPEAIRRPTVAINSQNGLNGISFDGIGQGMFTDSPWPLLGDTQFSAFAIYRKRTLTQGTVYGWGTNEVSLGSMVLFDNNSLVGYAYSGDNNYQIEPVPANTTTIQSYIKTPGPINTTSTTLRDGAPNAATGHSTGTPDIRTGPFYVGSFRNLAGLFLNGLVYEIVITSTVLPESLQRTVEGYMAWRWGIEESLAPSHPFRFVAP